MCEPADTSMALAYLLVKKEVLGSRFALEVIEPLNSPEELTESRFLREPRLGGPLRGNGRIRRP